MALLLVALMMKQETVITEMRLLDSVFRIEEWKDVDAATNGQSRRFSEILELVNLRIGKS